VYDATPDPYCYPDSGVLRNKANLHNADELAEFETAMTMIRVAEALPDGRFDYPHYLAIHRHLFQDVYEWAGQTRTIRLGKGGNMFCFPEYIDGEMRRLFSNLAADEYCEGLSRGTFAGRPRIFLAQLNAIHPFREGNGRTQLTFLLLLAENAGYPLYMEKLDEAKLLRAMITSFWGDESLLADLIDDLNAAP
jgi:cell filamentation protein